MGKNIIINKNILRAFLFTLIASIAILGVPAAHAMIYISVGPAELPDVLPGESFNVTVNVVDVINLGAIEFKLWYNTTLLDAVYTYLTPTSEDYLKGYGPLDPVTYEYTPTSPINDTLGRVYWYAIVKAFTNPFNGTDPVLTITFNATEMGTCSLHLNETVLGWIDPVDFYDGKYVLDTDYGLVDGSVTVVPEFPSAILMPLLLITTLTATFLAKIAWSKKRKDIHP